MFLQLDSTQLLINFTILKKVKDKQLVLLYLKFESKSNIINFESFSSQYKISYDSYHHILKSLKRQQIVKEFKKNNSSSKFKTYKLIKPNVQIFPHASKSDEKLVYLYLHSTTAITAETNSYIQTILNPNALQILKQIKQKYNSKPFKKLSILGNNSTTTNERAFKFLLDHNALRKVPLASQTYVLAQYYDQALQQAKLKKNSPVNLNLNLDSIIQKTKWNKFHNIHNLTLTIQNKGSYDDISLNPFYQPIPSNNKLIPILPEYEIEPKTFVTALVYDSDTLVIFVKCSENPILVNDTLRLNMILAEVFGHINNISTIAKQLGITEYYQCDYDNISISKHDFALDGIIPCLVPVGTQFDYTNPTNPNGKKLILYVKENYKSINSSWVRVEDRANNTKYKLPNFRTTIQNRNLDLHYERIH